MGRFRAPPPGISSIVGTPIQARTLDHVALWTDERNPLVAFLCDHLGMHVIERDEEFSLVGVDARLGKLTIFDADGPRQPGVLERIALRVDDLEAANSALPDDLAVREGPSGMEFNAPGNLGMALTEREGTRYDLDHVVLRVPDPDRTAHALSSFGLAGDGDALTIGERRILLREGRARENGRPMLNHLGLLVDSAQETRRAAERLWLGIDKVVDAPNTLAVFLRGPDGIQLEYVEHKPEFSLA
jgi:catechol 2,3-dioxygenase-like lactoylglutathione lyase family enzyme